MTIYIIRFSPVIEMFKREYPEIKVVTNPGVGEQASRILAERRAGKYLADVFSGGVSTSFNILYRAKALDSIRSALILPEVVDESKWYEQRHAYVDPENQYIFAYLADSYSAQLQYNSNMVNPKEFSSYWDMLNPKWKGKILSLDPALPGTWGALRLFYHHPKLGPDYLRKLFGEMEVKINRDDRLIADWLANGQFAICLACKEIHRAKSQGLPVDSFHANSWKEGGAITASPGTLSLVNRAPHPNAAKLFINWFLSRPAQTLIQVLGDPGFIHNSRRLDVPKNEIPPEDRLLDGRNYFDVSHPSVSDMKPILQLIKEATPQNR